MTGIRSKGIYAVLLMALLFLQYCLWFQKGGIRDMWALKDQLALQVKANQALRDRNQKLLLEMSRIQQSHDVAESKARRELGMIKEGETFYQIVK